MATAADMTIAAEGATFKQPEMTHNLPPTLAISALMTKVPRKAIAGLVYTLAEIDAIQIRGIRRLHDANTHSSEPAPDDSGEHYRCHQQYGYYENRKNERMPRESQPVGEQHQHNDRQHRRRDELWAGSRRCHYLESKAQADP
jgi:hypothetical protein